MSHAYTSNKQFIRYTMKSRAQVTNSLFTRTNRAHTRVIYIEHTTTLTRAVYTVKEKENDVSYIR